MPKFVFTFAVLLVLLVAGFSQQPTVKQPRRISVPATLADEYNKALDAESQALQSALQTPQYKDYLTAQQQRLRIETFIFGEVGCKPSLARIIRGQDNRIVLNKDGRIEFIECEDAKESKP